MRVTINGEIVDDEDQWLYDYFGLPAFSPAKLRQALEKNPEGEELVVEINSIGGSVFAGFEMYSVLRGAKCRTAAEVQSLAASAASTVMIGCNMARLSPVAQVMIHLPTAVTQGDVYEHQRTERLLDSIKTSILNGYELRCAGKTTRARLDELMESATWLPAQDAIALGLADGLLFGEDDAALAKSVVNAAGGLHSPAKLLERYEAAVRGGAAPAEGHPVDMIQARPIDTGDRWRMSAKLKIEQVRFL